MGKSGWRGPSHGRVGPSVGREDGVRDGRIGRPKISNEKHYSLGYEPGLRLRPK
jgi:hypothetical protein